MTKRTLAPGQDRGTGAKDGRVLRFRTALPPIALSPNRANGRAWVSTADERDAYRSRVYTDAVTAWFAAYGTRAPAMAGAVLSLRFVWCSGRRALDLDNALASFKQGTDALVRAHVIGNDSWLYLSYGSLTAGRCPRGCSCGGRVEVLLEEGTGQ